MKILKLFQMAGDTKTKKKKVFQAKVEPFIMTEKYDVEINLRL